MKKKIRAVLNFSLNFGPQHPAAHGVLRLILEMCGEIVVNAEPHIGFLHRGTEKLIENKNILQALPYFDRLDYVSMMSQEHGYSLAVENLFNESVTARASNLRVVFREITRILNHLMAITTHALDVGALTPFLWAFEEREKLMSFYEEVSGARMHSAFIRPGGVCSDVTIGFFTRLQNFLFSFKSRIFEIEKLLSSNRVRYRRLRGVGVVSKEKALSFGFSGVMLRASGVSQDLRRDFPYEVYNLSKFKVPVGVVGDCSDRYLIRVFEMYQSIDIILQSISLIREGPVVSVNSKLQKPTALNYHSSMEKLIHYFKFFGIGIEIVPGTVYIGVEAPKGEFGVYVSASGGTSPIRCKIKAPGLLHLNSLGFMITGHLSADAVACIGSIDVVFGEIDR